MIFVMIFVYDEYFLALIIYGWLQPAIAPQTPCLFAMEILQVFSNFWNEGKSIGVFFQ